MRRACESVAGVPFGGLLGIIHGFGGLPRDVTDSNTSGDSYVDVARPGLPDPAAPLPQPESIQALAGRMLTLAEENILLNGGRITLGRFTEYCHIRRQEMPPIEGDHAALIGPDSLIARAIEAGLSVTVDASVARYDDSRDRNNLASIIDGVVDNSYNGVRPCRTNIPGALTPLQILL